MTGPEHDIFNLDFHGDGRNDFAIAVGDFDAEGIPHAIDFKLDWDGDGRADASLELDSAPGHLLPNSGDLQIDLTHDGHPDAELRLSDVHQTGHADRADMRFDFDGDGHTDLAFATLDLMGDGVPDVPMPEQIADAVWGDVESSHHVPFTDHESFLPLMETHDDFSFHDFEPLWEMHGTPADDMAFWNEQIDPNSCAVATTSMMFHSLGMDVDEPAIAQAFEAYGIYDPAVGTDPGMIDMVVNDIAMHTGMPVHATETHGFSEKDLAEMLDNGVRPLVSIDSTDLYADHFSLSTIVDHFLGIPDAGHAVQVTAVVHSTSGDFVVINDPGFPSGAGAEIPLSRFMEAASPFGFEAIALMKTA